MAGALVFLRVDRTCLLLYPPAIGPVCSCFSVRAFQQTKLLATGDYQVLKCEQPELRDVGIHQFSKSDYFSKTEIFNCSVMLDSDVCFKEMKSITVLRNLGAVQLQIYIVLEAVYLGSLGTRYWVGSPLDGYL